MLLLPARAVKTQAKSALQNLPMIGCYAFRHGEEVVTDQLWEIVEPLLPPEPPKLRGGDACRPCFLSCYLAGLRERRRVGGTLESLGESHLGASAQSSPVDANTTFPTP